MNENGDLNRLTAEVVESSRPNQPARAKIGWIERILSPVVLQRLMFCGGGLLMVGFVVWLASNGVFENPLVLATSVSVANLLVLGLGVWMVRSTSYQLAGRGLAILGSLALPLNLWLYHGQGLIVLSQGGHLWIPAVVCCLIYAGVARSLRDANFVYALMGGVTLTGLLFLADSSVDRFWEILGPSTFLVSLGSVAFQVVRVFPESGDFSRRTFGRAFRYSGHVVLAGGLGLLLGGQVVAAVYDSFLFMPESIEKPMLLDIPAQKIWACGISLAATLTYLFATLRDRTKWTGLAAVFTGLWTGRNVLLALNIRPTESVVLLVLAFVMSLLNGLLLRRAKSTSRRDGIESAPALRLDWLFAVGLAAWGLLMYVRAGAVVAIPHFASVVESWVFVLQLAFTGLACWSVRRIWLQRDLDNEARLATHAGTISLALSAAVASHLLGWSAAPCSLVGPLAVASAVYIVGSQITHQVLNQVFKRTGLIAIAFTVVLASAELLVAPELFLEYRWVWAILATLSGSMCSWSASRTQRNDESILAGGFWVLAALQSMLLAGFEFEYGFVIAATGVGIGLWSLDRLISSSAMQGPVNIASGITRLTGCTLALTGGMGTIFLAGSRLLFDQLSIGLLGVVACQLAVALVLAGWESSFGWKQAFRLVTAGLLLSLAGIFIQLVDMNFPQKLELALVGLGGLVLTLSLFGLRLENEQKVDTVTAGLWLGSTLIVAPILVGLVAYRLGIGTSPGWMLAHEVGALLIGLLLFAGGNLAQLRSITIFGTGLLLGYVLTLLVLVPWPRQLQNTSLLMMVSGAIFFAIAILLSVYRDRLMAVPQKIREGKGIFKVLKWR